MLSLKLSIQYSPYCFPCGKPSDDLRRRSRLPAYAQHFRRVTCTMEAPSAAARRQANVYQPSLWSDDYIQSLPNSTAKDMEANNARIRSLKERVKQLLHGENEIKDQLELIDTLQQLGVAYHFKKDIEDALQSIHGAVHTACTRLLGKDDLYSVSLLFRLLRQQGLEISEDVFECFRDETGRIGDSMLRRHRAEGVLSMYEASYLAMEGESALDEAAEATTKHLKALLQGSALETHLRENVAHALDLPLNWRIPRLHARWFIGTYQKRPNMDPVLLEFAKLDFNSVQRLYKIELKQLSWWWNELNIGQKLPFSRDRLVENYFWATSLAFEPQFSACRQAMTKAICLVVAVDDIYDIYGTLDELELFTDAVDRWEVDALKTIPDYMKMVFLAIFNTTNDTAYEIMKKKGWNVIPRFKRAWSDLCKTLLVESKWHHYGHMPKLQEYMDNAWMTIGGHVAQIIAYCPRSDVSESDLESFTSYPDMLQRSCTVLRLCNDLATSTAEIERGDAPKFVQCYMHEKNVSEQGAREHVKELIRANWRALNGNLSWGSPAQEYLKDLEINLARTAHCVYQHGDGYGKPDRRTKEQVVAMLMEPISM